jgi:hypothetical protein
MGPHVRFIFYLNPTLSDLNLKKSVAMTIWYTAGLGRAGATDHYLPSFSGREHPSWGRR